MIALVLTAFAGPIQDGATLWAQGDLGGAIEAWEPTAMDGWGSGKLKFDLGNAYYRRGDLPRAIAWWRAAGLLRPRTSGVNHNLAIARSELSGVPTPAATPSLWMQIVTPGELGLVGLLLSAVSSGMLFLRRARKEASRAPSVVVWLLGTALVFLAAWGWWVQASGPLAVVVDRPAVLRAIPDLAAVPEAEVKPGAELAVLRQAGDFLLVETGDGRRGWVTDGAVFRPPR
ncbi:MAG: hypothetical protein H6734_12020 [Alphaproteobacteria bacterium]|nr:hypothetical protein [Alphaproteobacteria bacterium]